MAARKASAEEWAEYLALYQQLSEQLARQPWFAGGWETRFDYLNRDNPRGVWLQLVRQKWFDGAIHLETWINNTVLQNEAAPVVLHVETSMAKHGLSRNDFSRLFLERSGARRAAASASRTPGSRGSSVRARSKERIARPIIRRSRHKRPIFRWARAL